MPPAIFRPPSLSAPFIRSATPLRPPGFTTVTGAALFIYQALVTFTTFISLEDVEPRQSPRLDWVRRATKLETQS
jgi:hypothetical protein